MKSPSLRSLLFALFLSLLLGVIGFFYGQYIATKICQYEHQIEEVEILSSTIILDKISDQYFIVTKTIFLDQDTTISIDKGSEWDNFLWGQELESSGTVRIDAGIDLKELEVQDILVDNENRTITLYLPDAEVLDASLYGDLRFSSESGILRKFFQDDDSADYNKVVDTLIKQAKSEVLSDDVFFAQVQEDSLHLVKLILQELDYTVLFE